MPDHKDFKSYLISKLLKPGYGSQAAKLEYARISNTYHLAKYPTARISTSHPRYHSSKYPTTEPGQPSIAFWEKEYPPQLKELTDCPAFLFYEGEPGILNKKLITVVGTRRMSEYGRRICHEVLAKLFEKIKNTHAIVSGLAYGVDATVHRICLEVGIASVGVVAGGLGQGYPASSRRIYGDLGTKGLIVAEFPPGRPIVKGMFPMRNRIMAGLSSHTIVVESAIHGGSMITARLAAEYGREVIAFPGSVFSKQSEGCNKLISEGATHAASLEDLIDALGIEVQAENGRNYPPELAQIAAKLLQNYPHGFSLLDVQKLTMQSIGETAAMLTRNEMTGILGRYDNGNYYLIR
ncbi:MAG: DNA-processing protein DprA [Candidatus Dojkabacteria bacterium]|nr:MAG: DNA-processing protein DprA [Candidatus Dojkabacteria bacterium]